MKQTPRFKKSRSAATLFSLTALLFLDASAQITANDDGSAGSPFESTSEDSKIEAGTSVTANDTGGLTLLTENTTSAGGAAVTIDPATGAFTYNPKNTPLFQALAMGALTEDTFEYGITEDIPLTPGVTNELIPSTGVNSTGWGNLPATKVPDAGAPSSFLAVYDYSGTAAASTRVEFTTGWNTADMTLEFWIKQDTLEDVTLWETGGSGTGSGVYLTSAGVVKWAVKTGAVKTELDSTANMTAGSWHHVVITLDVATGTSSIFLDGAAAGTVTAAGNTNWSGTDDAGLGGVNGDAGGDSSNNTDPAAPSDLSDLRNPFNGELGLFRFYTTKAMSLSEVQANRSNALAASDMATVTVGVTGANDAPRGTVDVFRDGPLEDGTLTFTRDLTENDGVPGSGLRNLLVADLPGLSVTQSPSVGAPPGGGVATRAFDQNPRRFTHTDSNDNMVDHTWEVDFGQEVFLDTIVLANRADCCGERLRDITVTVKDSMGVVIFTSPLLNPANALGFSGNQGGELIVDLGAINGQTVTVTRTPDLSDPNIGNGSILSLGEVEIIGSADLAGQALLMNYDARYEASNDNWANVGSSNDPVLDWVLGSGVTLNSSVTSSRSQITAALEWNGTTDATASFPVVRGINDVFGGAVDNEGATIEAWVKLDAADLTQISTIFESGGGTGFGLVIDNGLLKAAGELDGGTSVGSTVSYDLVADPLGVLGGQSATAEFFQIAAVIRPEGGITLYVNGIEVAETTTGNAADWDGGDSSGIGRFAGDNHGGFQNAATETAYDTYFNGSMAMFRIYRAALDDVDVLEAFKAVDGGTDIDGDSIAIDGVVDASGAVVPLGSPATVASGALVTMNNATGEFLYDPNGNFNFLSNGQTATDSFVYRVDDGNGAKGYAEVIVTINGVTNAVDDTLALLEGAAVTFQPNAVIGNDDFLVTTADAFVDLSPAALADNTWSDAGLAAFNATVISPFLIAPSLESGFGAFGSAVGTGGATQATLDPISTADATVEVWFKPEPGLTGKYTVFETGGNGNGYSIVYDADAGTVIATVDGGDDTTQRIQAAATGVSTDEFNQVIVAYDRDGGAVVADGTGNIEDILTVYLNNDPTAAFDATVDATDTNVNGTANDWAGTDGSGIARVNGTSALNENFPGLPGAVGAVRVYERILTVAEMTQNYDAAKQSIISLTSPTTMGLPVTLNADGSFTYDPSSLADIAPGEFVTDSFTYLTQDGNSGTTGATVNLIIYGTGTAPNQQPTASLDSTVVYMDGATAVQIVPQIVADDPDTDLEQNIIPQFGVSSAGRRVIADPGNGGSNFIVGFTLAATDVVTGAKRVIAEIGGTSNGQGIYLIDGIPYFIAKVDGLNTTEPTDLSLDADWNDDSLVLVPLSGSALTAGSPQSLNLSYTGDSLSWEINGGGESTQALANLDARTNWSGDDSLGFGINSNGNGALSDNAGSFAQADFLALDGDISLGSFATYPAEELTATLTMAVADGSFTAPAGSSYTSDGTTGTWTATGAVPVIQQLLLDVEFIPTGNSPVSAAATISDGGEDGTVPVTGTVVFTTAGDTDSLDALLEFAFGTNPAVNDDGPLAIDGSANGVPIVDVDFSGPGVEFSAVFVRRDDFGTSGSVTYTPEFSSDLITWTPSTDIPQFVADSAVNPDYEVVKVAYPFFTPDGNKARFFRVRVTLIP